VHFDRLSIRDGLSQKDVYAILQDRQGFVWLGTRYGLNRYDGYAFADYRNTPFDAASLSDNWILSLHEDKAGRLWVGTLRGLNRLDPATGHVVRYHHNPSDAHSLSHDLVWSIYEDRDSTLWVGTDGGLNRLDRTTGRFTRYRHDPGAPHSLSSDRVYALHEDHQGRLWVSTANGLNRFNRVTGHFTRYLYNEQFPHEQRNDILYGIAARPEARPHVIRGICEDPHDATVLWVSTERGLLRFDVQTGRFTRHMPDPARPDRSIVMDVVPDPAAEGTLWLTTNGGGLYRFDTQTRRFVAYWHDPQEPTSIGSDKLGPLYVDRTGVIWVGSFGRGVSTFHPARGGFVWYRHVPGQPNSLIHTDVWTVYEDRDGALWMGTNRGLSRLDRDTGTYTHFVHDPNDPHSLSSSNVNYVFEDRGGTLWVATYGGGLNRLDRETGRFVHYRHDPEDAASLGNDFVGHLFEDRSGTLWAGTWGAGLHAFDRTTGRFTRYQHDPADPASLSDDRILDIYEDAAGQLWIATYDGLNRFDADAGRFVRYQYDRADENGLSHMSVYGMVERTREPGLLWLATPGGGLNRFDTRTGAFTHFTEADGLSNNRVLGVLEDDAGWLWMSTAEGLSGFDPESKTFRNYGMDHSLQVDEFNPTAFFKSPSGELFFGGINGVQAFFPTQIVGDPTPPLVVLTGLKLFNKPVDVGAGAPLPRPMAQMKDVRLGHQEKVITFEFVALHYVNPAQNQYAYRLDGFDEEWVMAGTQRSATYTNLSPGAYVFRVKAANSDGVWNEEGASIRLVILPPFWQTTWFYVLCVLGLFGAAYVGYRVRVRHLRAQARALEALVADRTQALAAEKRKTEEQARRLLDMDEAKNRFFANISHEFRTPLTLITGPLEDLLAGAHGRLSSDLREQHRLLLRNARRLLRLVNQLLDLARVESDRMELHRQPGDVADFLRELVRGFVPLAERREITLQFQSRQASQPLRFDSEKLEKVFSNLLSNALKFTPEGGKVWVTLGPRRVGGERVVEAVVKDTGPGIPREEVSRIFDRFVQVADAPMRAQGGTGIGLALAKELVEQHRGRILVESELGFGSVFIVRLPLDVTSSELDETLGGDGQDNHESLASPSESVALEAAALSADIARPPASERPAVPDEKTATILVVEDNAEVRAFLRAHLEATYRILEAVDGADGLATARETAPDLVLSDVMMPKMDGYALCQALKADERLRTIPVVLLTAKAGAQETVDGLKGGADDYIVKPFHMDELKARLATLIRGRRLARRQFSREIVVQPADVVVQPEEEAFLERVLDIVEAQLGDSTFGAGAMADAVGLSRRQFERRLKAITSETPAELLRRMRLERAQQLLAARSGTIAEVAYAVGFRSPSHFSKAFRNAFGVSPSAFSENAS
jgi:signal transduction histidine kinase/ligand-binding sensor domain-containing protein/DNA-binding response OmpR family regulator